MRGWLVVNSFMNTSKFVSLYEMLSLAFKKHDVVLEIKKASDISLEVGVKINNKPDFAIFWDKDVYLAERLENEGVRLFNSKRAVMLCDNKILMYQALEEAMNSCIKKSLYPILSINLLADSSSLARYTCSPKEP